MISINYLQCDEEIINQQGEARVGNLPEPLNDEFSRKI